MGPRGVSLGVGLGLSLGCSEAAVVTGPAASLMTSGSSGAAGSSGSAISGGSGGSGGSMAADPPPPAGAGGDQAASGGASSPDGLASAGAVGGPSGPGSEGGTGGLCPCDAGPSGADAARVGSGGEANERDAGACGPRSGAPGLTLEPSSIEVFALPIGSTRFAASGFDPCARVCASLIWDYSNNGLDVAPYCGDFLAFASFPYVVLVADRDEACPGLWSYTGLEPSAASGCIDPLARVVDAQVELDVDGERLSIRASNGPPR